MTQLEVLEELNYTYFPRVLLIKPIGLDEKCKVHIMLTSATRELFDSVFIHFEDEDEGNQRDFWRWSK